MNNAFFKFRVFLQELLLEPLPPSTKAELVTLAKKAQLFIINLFTDLTKTNIVYFSLMLEIKIIII